MAKELFVDTSGFYALLIQHDDCHDQAATVLRRAKKSKRRFVTTDYVLDESATLIKARGKGHLLQSLFDTVLGSTVCRVEWTDATRFEATRDFFLKHRDHAWSFTDCLSFQVMKEFRLRDALTKDAHFREAGFSILLDG